MEGDIRKEILETARCILLKEGYKGTATSSIARAVGISPSAVCLHFNEKKDLLKDPDISEEEVLQGAYNTNHTSILQMALILFEGHDYDGVSVDMLARESDYSKATPCQYFKDKEELYSAVMQEIPFYSNFLSIQPEVDGYDLEAAIKEIGPTYLAVFDMPERTAFTRTIIRDSKQHPEVNSIYHKNGIGYMTRCVKTMLRRYTGNLQEGVDIYLATKTYVGSLFGFAIQYKIVVGVESQYEDDEIVDTLTKTFLHGILYRI